MLRVFSRFVFTFAAFAVFAQAPQNDRLWHLRNLGKAFYENPTTHREAVAQFRAALALAPNSARERVNYGLALLRAGDTKLAAAQLTRAQQQDPKIPHTWFVLGLMARRNGDYAQGIEQIRGMLALVPDDAKAHYTLGALYKSAGQLADALAEFEAAARLDPNLAAPHFQLYNSYRQADRAADAARALALFQQIKKQQEGAPIPEDMEASRYSEIFDTLDLPSPTRPLPTVRFLDRTLASGITGIAAFGTDLMAWNPEGVRLFRAGKEMPTVLATLKDVVSIDAGGDDWCVLTSRTATIYRKEKATLRKTEVELPVGVYTKALWIDYDHDYDLDLMLLGERPVLMRNNGDGSFADHTSAFPFVKGKPLQAVHFALSPETAARDLIVSFADRTGVIYRDLLNGNFQAVPLDDLPAGVRTLTAADFNQDSFIDLLANDNLLQNRDGHLEAGTIPTGANLIASSALGDWVRSSTPPILAAVALDWNFAGLDAGGKLHYFVNQTAPTRNWLRITLLGVKNIRSANTAVVEVKAGGLYRKKIYSGGPLVFPLATRAAVDTVRITWPNGLIQNEPRKRANQSLVVKEAQRLSGSCPMIFTWNGSGFEFITDVLGTAPLGASSADGSYFPTDHDEYIRIPGSALKQRDGSYEIRITEELREVSYLDHVQLIAVDHPAQTEIFTNDKFKSPPFPEFRLFSLSHRLYPRRARDQQGVDVLASLLRRDLTYPDTFTRDYAGTAELHTLDLDFENAAPDGRAVLLLNGWVDWADGSTFVGASQRKSGGLVFPYLQVKDAEGNWKTVVDDMGIPSGKPKTIAVDLTGKFLSSSREVRIVTNLCVYWDEIYLGESAADPAIPITPRITPIAAKQAHLRYRGFSMPVIHPQRKQPERFDYSRALPLPMWNPTPGMYTRYGDVQELVTTVDDRLLIMGAGDEVTLRYPSDGLPALPDGWQRDFLLLVDGWAKDGDPNTAFSQTVEPLPFHGMSVYPYPANENFPNDTLHEKYRRNYLTRPALRLIRPLKESD